MDKLKEKETNCTNLNNCQDKRKIKVLKKLLIELGANSQRCQTIEAVCLLAEEKKTLTLSTNQIAHKLFQEKNIEEDLKWCKKNKQYSRINRDTLRRIESVDDFQRIIGVSIWNHTKTHNQKNNPANHSFVLPILQHVDAILYSFTRTTTEEEINLACKEYALFLKKYSVPISEKELKKEKMEKAISNLEKREFCMSNSIWEIDTEEEYFEYCERLGHIERNLKKNKETLKKVWEIKFAKNIKSEEEKTYDKIQENACDPLMDHEKPIQIAPCDPLMDHEKPIQVAPCDPLMDHENIKKEPKIQENASKSVKRSKIRSNSPINNNRSAGSKSLKRVSECRVCGKSRCMESDFVVYCYREGKAFNIVQLEQGNLNGKVNSKRILATPQKEINFEIENRENPYEFEN